MNIFKVNSINFVGTDLIKKYGIRFLSGQDNGSSRVINGDLTTASKLLASGAFSPAELVGISLKRIQYSSPLNAFVTIATDDHNYKQNLDISCKASAARHASGSSLSPLDGLPVAVKDNFCTRGLRTTCTSGMLSDFKPPYSASPINRLSSEAGAILMGKTNMDEFAMGTGSIDSLVGPTINPWKSGLFSDGSKNLKPLEQLYISGGSSGGSAVAVCTGSVFAALASDTGGSTRNPAAHCGIVGFKPSYGLVSRNGLIPLTHSLDCVSIMARRVMDVRTVFNQVSGWDENDPTTIKINLKQGNSEKHFGHLKIGIPQEYLHYDQMSSEVLRSVQNVKNLIESSVATSAAQVRSVSLPHTRYALSCYAVLNACEVASNFSCYDGVEYGYRSSSTNQSESPSTEELYAASRAESLGPTVLGRIFAGNYFLLKNNYKDYFLQALKVRRLISQDFDQVFQNNQAVDFILAPVTLSHAPLFTEWSAKDNRARVSKEDYFTQPANLAGLPAITIPVGLSEQHDMPLGIQLIGPNFSDYSLLAYAEHLEQLINFKGLLQRLDDAFNEDEN